MPAVRLGLFFALCLVGAFATPGTYAIDGTQYVIVATNGNKFFKIPSGNAVIAFSLFDPHVK